MREVAGMSIPAGVHSLLSQFSVKDDALERIAADMRKEFELGLKYGRTATSSIAMLPSFVPALPDGTERGKYVAIDLSGKNLRIMLLTLYGKEREPDVVSSNYMVHATVMKGTGDQLFNFIVNCLSKFLEAHNLQSADVPIGFVFSYPCELNSIRSARLLWWTKGFDIQDCLHKDVVRLLEDALSLNMTIKARVKAVMNDTVGQLAAAAHKLGTDCMIGVVIGYGCNASYLERVENISKLDPVKAGYNHENMVVVTEWEEFGEKGELDAILTQFDKEIDGNSVHKGRQIVDKLTGALYLGELVRVVAAQLCVDGLLFGGVLPDRLQLADGFPAKYISEILGDEPANNYKNSRRIMDEMEVPIHGSGDYIILQEICRVISARSAAIAAAAICALLTHLNRKRVVIGVGGALVQFHPTYMSLLSERLSALTPEGFDWRLEKVAEGSAHGAALIAAVADKLQL